MVRVHRVPFTIRVDANVESSGQSAFYHDPGLVGKVRKKKCVERKRKRASQRSWNWRSSTVQDSSEKCRRRKALEGKKKPARESGSGFALRREFFRRPLPSMLLKAFPVSAFLRGGICPPSSVGRRSGPVRLGHRLRVAVKFAPIVAADSLFVQAVVKPTGILSLGSASASATRQVPSSPEGPC